MRWAVERVHGAQPPATPPSPSRVGCDPRKRLSDGHLHHHATHAHVTELRPTVLLVQERRSDALREKIGVQGHTNVDRCAPTCTIFREANREGQSIW